MRSSFFGLEVARRAMDAHRLAMDVTGHNIANANTPGYRRQRVLLEPVLAHGINGISKASGSGQMGAGVMAVGIERIRDQFVDMQIRHTTSSLGRWEARRQVLEEIEEIFKEPSDLGLNAMLDRFWISWQELSKGPEDPGRRTSVQQEGVGLASALNLSASRLMDTASELRMDIISIIDQINVMSEGIATLNSEIVRSRAVMGNAADMEDKRDRLIDDLSKLVNITVIEDKEGSVSISAGGWVIVAGREGRKLSTEVDPVSLRIRIVGTDGQQPQINGGRVSGLLDAVNDLIPKYLENLDMVANTLIERTNALHRQGYDLRGDAGQDFFEGNGAFGIAVRKAILDDTGLVAAASSQASPGDGTNALALAQLKDAMTMVAGTATFGGFYTTLITQLGLDTQEAMRSEEVYTGVFSQQNARRQSVSGVSVDEELMGLIKHQYAFDAASRLVNVIDEMLDRIINGTGLVGR